MAGRTSPLWLAQPSRVAGVTPGQAAALLVGTLLLLLASLGALTVPALPGQGGAAAQTDRGLYEAIVAGLRGGGGYYQVTADALRAGGYPLKPFVAFRLPTLAVLQAATPPTVLSAALLVLAGLTGAAWAHRLRTVLPRILPFSAAMILLAGGLLAFVQVELVSFHEIWAGLLVALSLALWRPDRWVEPAALAAAAMLVRETAALYPLVMLGFALLARDRRQALGWCAALALFAIVLVAHAWAVSRVVEPLDAVSPGWSGFHGFGLFVRAAAQSTALHALPLWLAAPLVALALVGWAAWDDPLALRAVALLTAYALAIACFARLDTFYWALMIAPVLLLGIAFVPDAARDLSRAILDRRRVRVQRITR